MFTRCGRVLGNHPCALPNPLQLSVFFNFQDQFYRVTIFDKFQTFPFFPEWFISLIFFPTSEVSHLGVGLVGFRPLWFHPFYKKKILFYLKISLHLLKIFMTFSSLSSVPSLPPLGCAVKKITKIFLRLTAFSVIVLNFHVNSVTSPCLYRLL